MVQNCFEYPIQVVCNFVIPKTDHALAVFIQVCCSFFVMCEVRIFAMLAAVKFNNEACFCTIEISNVRSF